MLSAKDLKVKNRVVGLTGAMGSGKSEVTKILQDFMQGSEQHNKLFKMAQPLYDIQEYAYKRIGRSPVKDRKLLQWLGTEWGRSLSEDLWITLWRQEVRTFLFQASSTRDNNHVALCDDCRFDNEAKMIKDMGGFVIGVTASDAVRRERTGVTFTGTAHSSEQGIKEDYVDLVIDNSGSVSELRGKIRELLEQGKI